MNINKTKRTGETRLFYKISSLIVLFDSLDKQVQNSQLNRKNKCDQRWLGRQPILDKHVCVCVWEMGIYRGIEHSPP